MIRIIDRVEEKVVQKIVSPSGKLLRYQYGIPGKGMTECSTLSEARAAIGKLPYGVLATLGKAKLSLPSNA